MSECLLRSLSDNPNRPCFFLQYGQTFVLLDCALDLRSTLKFLPVTQVFTPALSSLKRWSSSSVFPVDSDFGIVENEHNLLIDGIPEFQVPNIQQIDAADLHHVLISNFTQLFALPYLIKKGGFTGKIFATEPTVQLARDVFQDMSSYLELYAGHQTEKKWRTRQVMDCVPSALRPSEWKHWQNLCSFEEFQECLSKIQMINFRQAIPLENCLTITPYSSGYCMGSCNWILESPQEKLCYLSDSSTLTTHILPIDLAEFRDVDVMIVSALNMDPARSPEESLRRMEHVINDTVRDGGNILIPFPTPDLLIDILEYLYVYAKDLPTSVPIVVLSSSGQSILSLSQVFSEWLNQVYREKAYLPEEPFLHGAMQRGNRLKVYPSVDGKFSETFRSPCIVLCTHFSLRFGPVVHLLSQWKSSAKNCIIFTDSEFMSEEALAPYLPVLMKMVYCPLDTRLKPPQLSKILEATQPKSVIIHERYVINGSPDSVPDVSDMYSVIFPQNIKVISYNSTTEIKLPLQCPWLEVRAQTKFLSQLPMTLIKSAPERLLIGRLTGNLKSADYHYTLEPTCIGGKENMAGLGNVSRANKALSSTKPEAIKLLRLLRKAGFLDLNLVEQNGQAQISGEESGISILILTDSTEISVRNSVKVVRDKIREVLKELTQSDGVISSAIELEESAPPEITPSTVLPAEPIITER